MTLLPTIGFRVIYLDIGRESLARGLIVRSFLQSTNAEDATIPE